MNRIAPIFIFIFISILILIFRLITLLQPWQKENHYS